MFSVYIIYSPSLDKYYIGYTSDITKRMQEHNTGVSTFTSRASDWQIKYLESYPTREDARKREQFIKAKKSRKYLIWLIEQG